MKHYIAVSLGINYKNIVIMGFSTEKKADNAIDRIRKYVTNKYGYTWFSVDYYGYSSLESVLDYYKNYNIVCVKERKSYFSDNAILWIDKKLCSINNLRTQ